MLESRAPGGIETSRREGTGLKKTILVVDDEAGIVEFVQYSNAEAGAGSENIRT